LVALVYLEQLLEVRVILDVSKGAVIVLKEGQIILDGAFADIQNDPYLQ
jgi:ABC-type branched-subunit amino acid transport system ATPase component